MDDNEAMDMMLRCLDEIRMQRTMNDRLAPKAEAYDLIKQVLGLMPQRTGLGAGEDLAWRLDKRIAELRNEMAAASQVAADVPA